MKRLLALLALLAAPAFAANVTIADLDARVTIEATDLFECEDVSPAGTYKCTLTEIGTHILLGNAATATALAANGANCSAGETPLGVDASGAVEGCYELAETDISDLAHLATDITAGIITEGDLDEDSGTPTDEDVLTYDVTGANFNWVAQSGLVAGSASDLACTDCINATEIEDIYTLSAGDTMTSTLFVDLDSDAKGVRIQANGTQSANLLEIENSATSDILTFVEAGDLGIANDFLADAALFDQDIDEVVLQVQGHSTQNADLLILEQSDGTDVFNVDNDGNVTALGTLAVANDSIGPDEVLAAGQTDEYCLTYETTGDTWEWAACGAAEVNDLEGTAPTAILDTEILIGTGSGTAAFAPMSGDATMANTGAVSLAESSVGLAEMNDEDHGDVAWIASQAKVTDVTCTDCINATEVEDIYTLTAGDTMAGQLMVDGGADEIQVLVQGVAGQTADLLVLEDSAGADVFAVGIDGTITTAAVANPQVVLQDSDSTPDPPDDNMRLYGNLTAFAAGTEDMDVGLASQIAGSEQVWLYGDSDGGAADPHLTLGFASLDDLTVTTDSTGDGEVVLPADSIGDAEVSDTLTASVFKGSGTTTDAIDLATAEVAGNLPVANLNSGTAADATTYWRGDGTWVTPAGAGTVTDVWDCATGDCNTPVIGTGERLDGGTATVDGTNEGILLPRATVCTAATTEGQICWDTDGDALYVGDGATASLISGGSGDNILIDTVAVVDPDFQSGGQIDFVDTSNVVTANINGDSINWTDIDNSGNVTGDFALEAGDVFFGNNGLIFEGSTQDAIELGLAVEDPTTTDKVVYIQNADHTLVGRDTTDTLTNKTINTASNTITVVEADVSDLDHLATSITNGIVDQPDIDDTDTLAGNPDNGANATWFGTTGLIFEGATNNLLETLLTAVDPTADRTVSLPDATGTLVTTGQVPANETDPTLTNDAAVTLGSGAADIVTTFDVLGTDGTITYDGIDFTFSAPIASGASATPTINFDDSSFTGTSEAAIVADAPADDNGEISLQIEAGTGGVLQEMFRVTSAGGVATVEMGTPGSNYVSVSEAGAMTAVGSGTIAATTATTATTANAGDSATAFFSSGTVENTYLPEVGALTTSGGTDWHVLQQTGAATYEFDWVKIRGHATDCTGITDGEQGELCWEADANTIYSCETATCNGAGWAAATAAGDGVGYDTVEEADTPLTQRANLNFLDGTRATMSCADDVDTTDCTVEAVATLSSYTDDLSHVEESTTVTDSDNGLDIVKTTYDLTVALDPSEVAEQAGDLADLVPYEDVTDGGIHHMTFTQVQTLVDTTSVETAADITMGGDISSTANTAQVDDVQSATTNLETANNDTTQVSSTSFVQQEINGAGGTNLTCATGTCNVDDAFLLLAGDSTSGNYTLTGDWDFSGGGIEIENGTTPPACTEGQLYLDTDATAGQQLMACDAGTFVVQGDGGGAPGADSIGTSELDDGADTPLTGQYIRVDTVDQAGIEYRTAGETLADIGAAASGANSDITSITGLTTDLAVTHGGTGAGTLTGLVWGDGTNALVGSGAMASGEILVGDGVGAPTKTATPALTGTNFTGIAAGAYVAASIDGDDIASGIAGTHLALTAASPDTLDLDADIYTESKCIYIETPVTDEEFYSIYRTPVNVTITEIWCEVEAATSVQIDFEIDDGTPTGVNGSVITCTTSGVTDSTLGGDVNLDDGDRIDLDLGTVSGTVGALSACFEYTIDDD